MFTRWIVAIVAFSVRRPRTTLALSLIAVGLALVATLRARVDSTLSGMLGGGTPSAGALARVVDEFQAAEDLLIVVTAPDGPPRDAQRRLLAYAERLDRVVRDSVEARGVITAVRWASDPAIGEFIEKTVIPRGALYLDDASFAAFLDRLKPATVREQLAQNEAMLAAPGPEATALAKVLVQDPFRLREFVQARLAAVGAAGAVGAMVGAGGPGAALAPGGAGDFSDDGRSLLIRLAGARPVNDIEFSKRLTALARGLAQQAAPDGLGLRFGGGYAIAATTATVIRSDAIWNTLISIAIIHVFLALAYRRFVITPTIIVLSASAGTLVAFGLYTLVHPAVTPMGAVIASMLAGLGVDYAIHFRSHHESLVAEGVPSDRASIDTARRLAGPAAAAFITTIFGFAAVALADVRMLRDFAILGTLGLTGAILGVLITLPAAMEVFPRVGAASARLAPIRTLVSTLRTRPRLFVVASGALLAAAALSVALTPGFLPPLETDTTTMHPRPNPPLETDDFLRHRFRARGDTLLLLVEADSAPHLVERCHDAAAALATDAARSAGVRATLGLATLLPDPRIASRRLADLQSLDAGAIVAGVRRELEQSAFDPAPFAGYLGFLHTLLTSRAVPGLDDVRASPALARLLLPARAVQGGPAAERTVMLVTTPDVSDDAAARGALVDRVRPLLAGIPDCTLTGIAVVSTDLERAVRRDLARSSAVSLALVVAWLFALFRRPLDVLLCLTPVVFSLVCVFGSMSAAGQRLSAVNIVAAPMMVGIAVDCGIFAVSVVRRARVERRDPGAELVPTIHAIFCTMGTTVIGFGTLIWTHTPAIRSLGYASLVGLLASLIGCILFLVPILLLYPDGRRSGTPR